MRTALSNARRDRITCLGVEVAFFAALALVPGLLVLVALLGSIEALIGQGLAERAEAVLLDLFRSILTEDAGDALAGVRRLFEEERPGLLTLGIASTLLASFVRSARCSGPSTSCTRSGCPASGGSAVPGRSPSRS